MFKLNKGERGQSIVLIALIMAVLIALIALVTDIGFAFAQRRNLQNAADAASLAGTLEYVRMFTYDPKNPEGKKPPTHSTVRKVATNYIISHGLKETDIVYIDYVWADGHRSSVPEGTGRYNSSNKDVPTGVQVMVGKHFNTFFAGVVGQTLLQASAVARDLVQWGINEAGDVCIFPAVVDKQILDKTPDLEGTKYCFWDGPQANCPDGYTRIPEEPQGSGQGQGQGKGADQTAPGNWGWIGWGDNDAPTLREYILKGRCGSWKEGDYIEGGPGIMSTLDDEVRQRKADDPYIVIPVYDEVIEQGSNTVYHTIKLVTFHLDSVNMQGSNKYIAGTFVELYVPCINCQGSGDDTGGIIVKSAQPVP